MAQNTQLLAIVEVGEDKRVRCQFPGCKQTIYKSIHVIAEQGELKVIGSTCVTKGAYGEIGLPAYTSGGDGKLLSDEERQMLLNNTSELVSYLKAQFELELLESEQKAAVDAAVEKSANEAAQQKIQSTTDSNSQYKGIVGQPRSSGQRNHFENPNIGRLPWTWVDPKKSILCLIMGDASGWVRVQDTKGRHHFVPFPEYDGWDEFLPKKYGEVNEWGQGYLLVNVVQALQYLRGMQPVVDVVCSSFSQAKALRQSR